MITRIDREREREKEFHYSPNNPCISLTTFVSHSEGASVAALRGHREGSATRVPSLVCKLAVRGVASGLAYSRRVQALCARYRDYHLKKLSKTRLKREG